MTLDRLLAARNEAGRPVRVGLIGAGKFGSMFLTQAPTTAGLEVAVIADLDVDRARQACRDVGWSDDLVAQTRFTDDVGSLAGDDLVDVVVEATGDPVAGTAHARRAIEAGKFTPGQRAALLGIGSGLSSLMLAVEWPKNG